jgi:hypothetical protein
MLTVFIVGRLPGKLGGVAYHRLHHLLLRPIFTNIVINNLTAASTITSPTTDQYMRHILICLLMDVVACTFMIFMLITSIMFEFQMLVLVAIVIIFNILNLIMKLLTIYLTIQKCNSINFYALTMIALADALKPDKFISV